MIRCGHPWPGEVVLTGQQYSRNLVRCTRSPSSCPWHPPNLGAPRHNATRIEPKLSDRVDGQLQVGDQVDGQIYIYPSIHEITLRCTQVAKRLLFFCFERIKLDLSDHRCHGEYH